MLASCCRTSTAWSSRARTTRARCRPATLARWPRSSAGPPAETVADPRAALERARALAGPGGAVLATGSIYLIADLVREEPSARASSL